MQERHRSPVAPSPEAPPGAASPFVVGGFLAMWLVGLYPLLASVLSDVSPMAAVALLVLLPPLMTAVLYPLWLEEERAGRGG